MNNLTVNGTQNFMEREIPVVYGGFGENQKCIADKTIAEIHGQPTFEIRKSINRNIQRFKENIDFIDLKIVSNEITNNLLSDLGYTTMQISKAEHIYILSERGYAKLIKIMDSDLAWEIHDKLIDEYFTMREEKESNFNNLSPMLQTLISLELKQQEQDNKINAIDEKVDSIKEIVALNPNDWRKDTTSLINKMALSMGGYENTKVVRRESYKLLDERFGVSLQTRLTNKRRRLADEGVCKSKRDKLNQLDVITDDKKLIEGYVAIIKEMAVRYGVSKESVAV